jgi:Fur family ferric uptake transcriptional regulator
VRSPDELTAMFRARGWKVTPQRQLLFRLLHGNSGHPSAEALYAVASEAMPGISRRTVYQTLNDLAALGELHVLNLGTGSSRFDPNLADHQHAVCDTCGSVHDVTVPGVDALEAQGAVGGFSVHTTQVVFRGRCAECAATSRPTFPPHVPPKAHLPHEGA